MDKVAIGKILRVIRIANDLSKRELAKNTDVSVSYICEIEKGIKKPSDVIIEKILNYSNIIKSEFYDIFNYYESIKIKDKLKKYQYTLLYVLKLIERK